MDRKLFSTSTLNLVVAVLLLCKFISTSADPISIPESITRDRTMPPPAVGCDRNHLTSYSGFVSGYNRTQGVVSITISTDWGTEESISIAQEDDQFESYFLMFNRPFSEEDWKLIEIETGRLREGVRATAWICLDGTTPPVIDWQPGLAEPGGRRR